MIVSDVTMSTDLTDHHWLLANRKNATLEGWDRDYWGGVNVDDAPDIGTGSMNCGVQRETRQVYAEVGRALLHHSALHVHFHQAWGSHFVEQHSVRINKEVLLVLVQSGSDLRVDALTKQTIAIIFICFSALT